MHITDKVRELQELIKEKYGVESKISIKIHSTSPRATKELQNHISLDIASNLDVNAIMSYKNIFADGSNWVSLESTDLRFTGFYRLDTQEVHHNEKSTVSKSWPRSPGDLYRHLLY